MDLSEWNLLEIAVAFVAGAAVGIGFSLWLIHLRSTTGAPASGSVETESGSVPSPDPLPEPMESSAPDSAEPRESSVEPVKVLRTKVEPSARISRRVLQHLFAQARLGAGVVPPWEMTQAGMVQSLGVSQSALAKVLRRLVLGGVLAEERQHARGVPYRVKVYRLTPLGELLARDLQRKSESQSTGKASQSQT
jgi:DNA-binding MarR family transcriptional regulator